MDASSQTPIKNYEPAWKKVEDFVKKDLPASALSEVKKIYAQAKRDKQDAQVIKSLVYMNNLQYETREENDKLSIAEIEKEIPGTTGAVNALLNSLLAGKYWDYFQSNRWRLYNRTQTADFKKEDISTWTMQDFHQKISSLFILSLKDKSTLQKSPLKNYDAVIDKGNMRHLRPTLYDLLAFQALNYFSNDERDINKPAYSFEINQASAFDPAADFIHRRFETKDTSSLYYKALLILQDLLAFHLNDEKPDALIDADIFRYQFVRSKSTHPDKDQLYFYGINHIAHQYESLPAAAQAWYLVAEYHSQLGASYDALGDTSNRYEKVKAREIAEKTAAQKDSSEGKMNAINLLQQLTRPMLSFKIEQVNLPGKPLRSLIEYSNLQTVYLRVIKATPEIKKMMDQYDNSFWKPMIAAQPVRSWKQDIPDTKDLQRHRVEIKIDPLPTGEYFLVASSNESFAGASALTAAENFFVSAISYVNNGRDYFVLNRENGQPLRNAAVQVWEREYDYSTSVYRNTKGPEYKTDANGYIQIKQRTPKNSRSSSLQYAIEVTTKDDHLFLDGYSYEYFNRDRRNVATTSIFLFNDRGIYRPGQTVYFKGIVLTKDGLTTRSTIRANYSTTIYLQRPDGGKLDSLKVKTNEFGSFSGKFQLPPAGNLGRFLLVSEKEGLYKSFSVEEYKRPKFFVEYEPLKGSYRVNDQIEVTGTAKAYAGNNISGANVKYRVVREVRFLYPWMFSHMWQPAGEPMEITHGETATDADGKFRIKFEAIPDLKIDAKMDPAFDYVVYADITDVNGETRSGQKNISVSYKALLLKANIPDRMPADSLNKIFISTENNNGEFEPASVTVRISKLKAENRLIRKRLWQQPDQFIYTKEEYLKYFPFDKYNNESDPSTWPKEKQVLEKTDSTVEDKPFRLDGMIAESGVYIIEISTKDKDGKDVKEVKYVTLFDSKSNKPEIATYFTATDPLPTEPGQSTVTEIASSADNLFVIQQVDKRITVDSFATGYSFLTLDNEKKKITITATEADRGGYGLSWVFVKHNQLFAKSSMVNVPWSNKELNIEYASYRDKTLPGSKEQWRLKISGAKGEILAAEMLAGMYDASLDQFAPGRWREPGLWPIYSNTFTLQSPENFKFIISREKEISQLPQREINKEYDRFIFGSPGFFSGYGAIGGGFRNEYNPYGVRFNFATAQAAPLMRRGEMDTVPQVDPSDPSKVIRYTVTKVNDDGIVSLVLPAEEKAFTNPTGQMFKSSGAQSKTSDAGNIQPRTNFNETAFFFPDLKTDSTGAIEFSFTMPEALTRWKFQALAHTKDLAFGYTSKEIVTQKDLMVQPNAPRFLREGDQLVFNAKIVNLSDKELNGNAELQLYNAGTNQPVDILFNLTEKNRSFKVAAGQSTVVFFPLNIPSSYADALTWRVIAKADNFSDGEENMLPVLSNRMLVTETISLPMRGNGTKNFSFDKLKQSGNSKTLQQRSLTVEYTSNPVWYAVQSLPYLMEYPYDCAEQTWNRYYANSLAASIANSAPKLKQLFDRWKTTDTAALLSNLQKNQELKSILLEETPWVLEAKTEAKQKQNLALLFDMLRMTSELNGAYEKLKQLQSSNGGFVWFSGGPDDRYMTQYIITGIGHLLKLKGVASGQNEKLKQILERAIPYLDRKLKEDYDNLVKYKTDLRKYIPSYSEIQYFYMRSFFPGYKVNSASMTAYNYFKSRLPVEWTKQNKYMQGMTALALHRLGDKTTPAAILKSLKETSISNEELGMYWKDANRGWWWYESPIERQALLIEAFSDISNDTKTVNDLRTWLLKNKQTNKWESTKATAEACYALLLQGTDWTNEEPVVSIKLGNTTVSSADNKQEAGTGYFSKTFDAKEVKPEMGNIAVTVSSANASASSWGGVYWQYFENLDKITTAATPLQLQKKLFIETNTDRGPVLTPVKDGAKLKIGDKIKVRIELRSDRDMEYVHMKDMRASAFEPVNVLSSYKWQDGLGYYESTRDASTNFFFDRLRKGTYVFEYTLFVTHSGNFSNGVTTIQCMYAPEFSAHSEGVRVSVE
ncbi:MAG: alpha-2-macroglobulin [Citrobacter freundii]|nr:MAG: alpha-2-macroglobulin [Citrobacter freundii]